MPRNQLKIHSLLRKSLVAELFDTQFYLFSARSKRDGNAIKVRALFANNEALASGSEYFNSLLSEKPFNDPTLVELHDRHICEEVISLSEYGYASDSDLDEEDEEGGIDETAKDNDKCAQRIIPSRRVLVTDTAFNTWQALLYYLYTDEIVFAPLRSQGSRPVRCCRIDEAPPCSPKSVYRLACKINHDELRAKALAAMRSSLTEHDILQERSLSLKSSFSTILEDESLFRPITIPIATGDFPTITGADPSCDANV
ncbi:hypothetical protein CY34DRAFT_18312 [Suillus luteus UH-Slu-Lm8-n1]|uniref:Unplaced genomic scaffold CY34scaffold_792, whole genome shotgun sequence n=1 Tax=Suillus luteus UH-Slu-Lm8-n1 TaxID=930992 RepID=A0A0C9Z7P1_9AGAM|nr:hypothetical protein CY34DRAFT_18312 [Suillus luteus UH-Slu-Lm8-n1]